MKKIIKRKIKNVGVIVQFFKSIYKYLRNFFLIGIYIFKIELIIYSRELLI